MNYIKGPYSYEPETFDEHGWINAPWASCIAGVNTPTIEEDDDYYAIEAANDQRNATGHLLAAAPAMYEAIKKVLPLLASVEGDESTLAMDIWVKLYAALPTGEDQ